MCTTGVSLNTFKILAKLWPQSVCRTLFCAWESPILLSIFYFPSLWTWPLEHLTQVDSPSNLARLAQAVSMLQGSSSEWWSAHHHSCADTSSLCGWAVFYCMCIPRYSLSGQWHLGCSPVWETVSNAAMAMAVWTCCRDPASDPLGWPGSSISGCSIFNI